jgi:hypothetical protein
MWASDMLERSRLAREFEVRARAGAHWLGWLGVALGPVAAAETAINCVIAATESEIARLRVALRRYGRHDAGCTGRPIHLRHPGPCTCGLDAALEGKP